MTWIKQHYTPNVFVMMSSFLSNYVITAVKLYETKAFSFLSVIIYLKGNSDDF